MGEGVGMDIQLKLNACMLAPPLPLTELWGMGMTAGKNEKCAGKKIKRGKGKGENGSENRMKRPEKIILIVGGGE